MGRKKKAKIEEEIYDIKIEKLKLQLKEEETRIARLDLQERALLGLIRSGQAKPHAVTVEILPDKLGNRRKRTFRFYKLQVNEDNEQREILPQQQLHTGFQ